MTFSNFSGETEVTFIIQCIFYVDIYFSFHLGVI